MILMEQLKQHRLTHFCIAITFFTSGLIINFLQLISVITIKPLNAKLFRKLMYYLCYSIYSQFVFITDWYSNSTIKVYMDSDDFDTYVGKEHALLIMNHAYEIDWLAGWMFTEKMGVLGNCKAYAKKVLAYVPVIGWAWKFADFIFLERNFDKDKEIISHQLNIIFSYPYSTWLLLNAEGTRFTPQKHKASITFAKKSGLQPLKHHLIPRTKGFTTSLPSLRGLCPAIYDINLAFKKDAINSPTLWTLLNGKPVEAFMYIRRLPLDRVPDDEQEASAWLYNLFSEKDKIIDSFHKTGSFFHASGHRELTSNLLTRRLHTIVNFTLWAIFTISMTIYYLITSLRHRNCISLSICLTILLTIYILMARAINVSKISKASNYGVDAKTANE